MGLLAFAVNALAHSFIGSFEIKYMFWFLAALVIGLARPEAAEGGSGEAPCFGGVSAKLRAGAAVLLLAYAGVLTRNAMHSLSLPSRAERYGLRRDFGLDKVETAPDGREYRWTRKYGGIPLKIEKPDFVLPVRASHPDIREKPVGVKVFLVEEFFKRVRPVGEIVLADGEWRDVAISAPGEVGREAVLLVKVSRTWNPSKATGVPDPRNLGVAVGKIVFRD